MPKHRRRKNQLFIVKNIQQLIEDADIVVVIDILDGVNHGRFQCIDRFSAHRAGSIDNEQSYFLVCAGVSVVS